MGTNSSFTVQTYMYYSLDEIYIQYEIISSGLFNTSFRQNNFFSGVLDSVYLLEGINMGPEFSWTGLPCLSTNARESNGFRVVKRT